MFRSYIPYCLLGCLIILLGGCAVYGAEENNTGISLYNQAEYGQALQSFQAAQVAAYDQADYYFNAGNAYVELGDFDNAIAAFMQALKTADGSKKAQIYYNLGNTYYALQSYSDAINAYQQALLLNSEDNDARHNLELALQQMTPISPTLEATPTAESQQEEVTPTSANQPEGNTSPTPSLSNSSPDISTPLSPDENSISPEDAQRLLDGIQQNQQSLQQYLQTPALESPGKDW